ncbi:MAG: ECF subfamily RNA polymerase sigma-24 subunit, RNA polymerase sigma-70 factor, ECF subfamily [Candidatus Wolfebacteria bacterium GW2011_GWC1_43_10]|uniref:RNA polymerase sigma factor n=1 Tax=Candidatus Wolfebacteria bacterium GW2011_GWC1_43_10 TaxID=1619011 RepID=A0A0G1CBR3_9BACT|nr:MAG: ECF subfamily RNA polymerase sigma-24 subunit, RNA polymerase sigma-70 factor, ECF subfamily [Candidatus Wolfebacteria bacterium GW2011_GWC1_43_10]
METNDRLNQPFEELIEKASRMDEEAFTRVYQEYTAPIFHFFFLRLRDRTLAEDLAQIVFLKAWENIRQLQEVEKILAWLFKIARNTLIDYWRKKKEINVPDFSALESGADSTEPLRPEDLDLKMLIEEIWEVLEGINEEQREVIVLRFFEGMSPKEIEEIMGKSSTAVRSLQYRALTKLKKVLLRKINK